MVTSAFAAPLVFLLAQEPLPQKKDLQPLSGNMYLGQGVRAEYQIDYKFLGSSAMWVGPVCENVCVGKKHLLHKECDTSCDSACPQKHLNFVADVFHGGSWEEWTQNFSKIAKNNGVDSDMTTKLMYGPLGKANREFDAYPPHATQYAQTFQMRCWNRSPCSIQHRSVKYNKWLIIVHMKISKETVDASGKMTVVPVSQFDYHMYDLLVPSDQYEDDPPIVNCKCSIVKEIKDGGEYTEPDEPEPKPPVTPTPDEHGPQPGEPGDELLPPPPALKFEFFGAGAPAIGTDNQKLQIGDGVLNQFHFEIVLNDMNGGEVIGTNPFPVPFTLYIPPGCELDTDDDGLQDCLVVGNTALNLPPMMPFGPAAEFAAKAPVRVMCMEMTKHEPSPSAKYKLSFSKDAVLLRIAEQISKTRFRGPWDQAKVWAYTDGATYHEIRKRLIPAPGKGRYANGLYEIWLAGGDFNEAKLKRCVEPALLTQFGSDAATKWLAFELLNQPEKLAAWSKDGAAEMAKLVSAESDKSDVRHFVRVCDIFAASSVPQAQAAALAFLSAVPDSSREKLMSSFLLPVWTLCWSKNKEVSETALKLLNDWNPPEKPFILLNMPKN